MPNNLLPTAKTVGALSDIDAADVARCARVLLRRPLLRADGPDGDLLPLIYRHRLALQDLFLAMLGYQLVVQRRFARLYKSAPGNDSTRGEANLSPRGYAYLALAITALTGVGRQVLLSRLVGDIRSAAMEAGIVVRDDLADRRALTAALRHLLSLGVISETEGTVGMISGESPSEALITIDTDLLGLVLVGSIADLSGPDDFIAMAELHGARGTEHLVRRRLVEDPVVLYQDLPEDQAQWLRKNRRKESALLERYFGLITETRLEGIAVTDPEDYLTDVFFPGTSTAARIALLALPELLSGGETPRADGRYLITIDQLRSVCVALLEQFPTAWSRRAIEDTDRLVTEVLELLVAMKLAINHPNDGWLISPAAHRWVPCPDDTPARVIADPVPEPGWSLFDEEGGS